MKLLRSCLALAVAFMVTYLASFAISQDAQIGEWSNWEPITACTARSCHCDGRDEPICDFGTEVQIRTCPGHARCLPDEHGHGFLRMSACQNGKDTCPGWSAWRPVTACIDDYQTWQRFCNNPPPLNPNNSCDGPSINDTACEPENELTTVTSTVSTTLAEQVTEEGNITCTYEELMKLAALGIQYLC